MSSGVTPINISRLMTTFNIEIEALPDGLKCQECKSVLNDACQVVPCGCRFCRICIDHVMANGVMFCPGGSQRCGETPLLTAHEDFRANVSISKLIIKCPMPCCSHECPLVDMECHLQECQRKAVDCPFRGPGGPQQSREQPPQISDSHSEILIGLLDNLNRDVEVVKSQLAMKNEQIRTITVKMKHVQNENQSMQDQIKPIVDENKSIKDENEKTKNEIKSMKEQLESIKREKEALCDRVRQLEEKLDREIDERRQSDERGGVSITAVTETIGSDRDAPGTEMEPVVNGETQSIIRGDIDSRKAELQSTRGRVDARCDEWVIVDAVAAARGWSKSSSNFSGAALPYTYRLVSDNYVGRAELWIHLYIFSGPGDPLLEWPFRGAVTITVANSDRHAEACCTQTRQCRIERPPDNQYSSSEGFRFRFGELRGAGLDLERPVRVSCQVAPGAGQ